MSLITPIKTGLLKVYLHLLEWVVSRLLNRRIADIVSAGAEESKLRKFYQKLAYSSFDNIYKDPGTFSKLDDHSRQEIVGFYLDVWRKSTDVLFNKFSDQLMKDRQYRTQIRSFYNDFFKGSMDVLLLASKEDLTVREEYGIKLGEGFEELVDLSPVAPIGGGSEVTVIYSVCDRDPDRIAMSILSLRKASTIPFDVIVVDYGSQPQNAQRVGELCEQLQVRLIRSETEGLPWSRSKALNIGIRAATTKFVVTTDIDMVFEKDALAVSLERHRPKSVIHCRPRWLPESGNKSEAFLGDYNQLGGYQFIDKKELEKAGVFNEEIRYWGIEDIELNSRLMSAGFESIWIDEQVDMYHVWHPLSYGALDKRPFSSWIDSNLVLMKSQLYPAAKQEDYGTPLSGKDRRILGMLKTNEPHVIQVDNYPLEIGRIVEESHSHNFLRLNLGSRFVNSTAPNFVRLISPMSDVFTRHGVEMTAVKNKNFDYFYSSLEILQNEGLVDYYIPDECDYVLLLFSQK